MYDKFCNNNMNDKILLKEIFNITFLRLFIYYNNKCILFLFQYVNKIN